MHKPEAKVRSSTLKSHITQAIDFQLFSPVLGLFLQDSRFYLIIR